MIHLIHSNESGSINDGDDYDDDDEQPADKVLGGGGERPLGEKLPNGFVVKDGSNIWNLTGAIELHRVVLEDNPFHQLQKQKDEITRKIIDSTCSADGPYNVMYKEVSQPPLPLLRRSRHCGSHVG